jgi:hypothetical protein
MMTLAFAFATALAAPIVHVENEVGTHVFVDRIDDGEEHVVCHAPCNAPLEIGHSYRLRSDAFRATNKFRLPNTSEGEAVAVRIEPRTSKSLVSAVVLMTISGVFATLGGFAIAWGVLESRMTGVAVGLAIPSATVSVATGVPGLVLLGRSMESHATPVTVPIFTKTF